MCVLSFLWLVVGVVGHPTLLGPVLIDCVFVCAKCKCVLCMFQHLWECAPVLYNFIWCEFRLLLSERASAQVCISPICPPFESLL